MLPPVAFPPRLLSTWPHGNKSPKGTVNGGTTLRKALPNPTHLLLSFPLFIGITSGAGANTSVLVIPYLLPLCNICSGNNRYEVALAEVEIYFHAFGLPLHRKNESNNHYQALLALKYWRSFGTKTSTGC
jgi:hypothetical protein